jgi:hypothetical protein
VGTRSRNVERQSQPFKTSAMYPVDRLQQLQTALPPPSPRIRIPNLSHLTLLHSRSLVRIWGLCLLLLRVRLVDWHRGLERQVEGRASSWQNLRLSSRSSRYLGSSSFPCNWTSYRIVYVLLPREQVVKQKHRYSTLPVSFSI